LKKKAYPTTVLFKLMGVSRSVFYAWLNRQKQPFSPEDFKLRVKAKEVFEKSNETYGSR
jgi:hypothetical protein